jgi:hypothetical protein
VVIYLYTGTVVSEERGGAMEEADPFESHYRWVRDAISTSPIPHCVP